MNNLETLILNFKKQLEAGFEIPKLNVGNNFSNIILCGMGGSSLASDLLPIFLNIKIPIYTNRNYKLPRWADKNSLIICISYSGNTEETLSTFKEALKKKITIISISSGGKLQQAALKYKIPFIKIPFKNIPPRFSIWFQLASLMKILFYLKIIKKSYINKLLNTAKKIKANILKEQAKNLAKKLTNKIPLIYASADNRGILKIWKANFNENAKSLIFYNVLPEADHNEIAFLENKNINKNNFYALFFQIGNESPQIRKRIKLTAQLFQESSIKLEIINFSKRNFFESLFSLILLGELTSINLAKNYNLNPEKIEIIEKFKKMMK